MHRQGFKGFKQMKVIDRTCQPIVANSDNIDQLLRFSFNCGGLDT